MRKEPPVTVGNEKLLFNVIKAAFSQRRKTLANSLSSGLSLEKSKVNELLINSGVETNARAEKLTLDDFANITNNLQGMM